MTLGNRIRLSVIDAVYASGKGHLGGSLSCADILSVLYSDVMAHDPKHPDWPDRDRFIMSKGHCANALYATLAEFGYFPSQWLSRLNQGHVLGEHPCRSLPGVECSTGSLGMGLSVACGMAMAGKRAYVLLGDGECHEGQVWEAASFAGRHQLGVTAIVDCNGFGVTSGAMPIEMMTDKWAACQWDISVVDGHDSSAVRLALTGTAYRPKVIIAKTTKGKGVSFMEETLEWHHGSLTKEQYEQAKAELCG